MSRLPKHSTLFFLVLATIATFVSSAQAGRGAPRAHCLLAFDTNDRNVGPYCELGKRTVLTTLFGSTAEQGSNQRMQWHVLSGNRFSMRSVLNHLSSLRVQPQDTVFFYYLAHGGQSKSTGHFLAFPDGNLDRTKIRTMMVKTGARQSVLVTDCCSNLVSGVQVHAARVGGPNRQLIDQLFFGQRGLTDIISSRKGHYAVTDKSSGGIFTGAFCANLYERVRFHDSNRDGLVSWKEFATKVSRSANERFQQMYRSTSPSDPLMRSLKAVSQNSHYARQLYSNAILPLQYTRRLKVVNKTNITLLVRLQYYAYSNGKWYWRNATPGDQSYRIGPGVATMLNDGKSQVAGHLVRFTATSTDGKRRWTKWQEKPLRLAPAEGYVAPQPATFTYNFTSSKK